MEELKETGYVYIFNDIDFECISLLNRCKEKCRKLVVGIPSDELVLRMTNRLPEYSFELKKKALLSLKAVSEVIAVDTDNIGKRDSYEQINYDLCFYGTEYGRRFQVDQLYLKNYGVAMVSLQPDTLEHQQPEGSLFEALKNTYSGHKIILFGTGAYFDFYMDRHGEKFMPAYAVDNNKEKWNTKKNGVLIKSPEALKEENPDKTLVVLCCKNYQEVLRQLLEMGNFDYRPLASESSISILEEYAVELEEENEYLHRAHGILMKLMREFDSVCRKYGLHYYVISGALIGIVRHQGLIPWDDDIDVAMPRTDFNILKEKAGEIWKDSDYLFLDYDRIGRNVFYDFMSRLVYLKEDIPTGLFRNTAGRARQDILNRMVLDIYVLDNTEGGTKHKVITNGIKGVYALAMGHRGHVSYEEYYRLSGLMRVALRVANGIGRMIPLNFLFFIYEKLRNYANRKECDLCFESNGVINYMPMLYEKKLYGEGTILNMNELKIMAPADYDGLLKAKGYGDYMSFPPANKRKPSHSVNACKVIW